MDSYGYWAGPTPKLLLTLFLKLAALKDGRDLLGHGSVSRELHVVVDGSRVGRRRSTSGEQDCRDGSDGSHVSVQESA